MRIRFAGFGGQGVVLCGFIFGKAAMLEGKNAIHTQSYGSASRGGLTKSDVGIAATEIYDLAYDELDILVTLSQQSYDKYRPELRADGLLFYESDLVRIASEAELPALKVFGTGATDIAYKKFGRKIMANMIMLGFVNEIAQVVDPSALCQTISESVPPGTAEKNLQACAEGERLGREALANTG
jgi:2-oxoglutarate ferredoxin oxidoreductase subunit gamma